MKDKKGFTLIELIAVIVILGILMIIAFPNLSRLMASNDKRKYDQYHEFIKEAAAKFSRNRMDDLGGVQGEGCIDDVSIADLEEAGLIKEYKEDNVICGLPSNFNYKDGTYGNKVDKNKDYVNIRIRNNKGQVTVENSLMCVNNKNKVVYTKLIEKSGACNKYVASDTSSLLDRLKGIGTTEDNETYYLNDENNYVKYSNLLWRIVNYNVTNRTIKLVTNDNITILNYDNTSSTFPGSNVDIWLNNVFLKNLRSYPKYLENAYWNYTQTDGTGVTPYTDVVQRYVGLLSYDDYANNTRSQLINYSFTLTKSGPISVWTMVHGVFSTEAVSSFYGVRPSIVLKANIPFKDDGSKGTIDDPLEIVGEGSGLPNTKLSDRFLGEYVKIKGTNEVYKIIEKGPNYTKLMLNGYISDPSVFPGSGNRTEFDDLDTDIYSSGTLIAKRLNEIWKPSWYDSLDDTIKEKIIENDYCTSVVKYDTKYQVSCNSEDLRNELIGLPRVGDIFVTPDSVDYWTLSRGETKQVNVISSTLSGYGYVKSVPNGQTGAAVVKPIITLKDTAIIESGDGVLPSTAYVVK